MNSTSNAGKLPHTAPSRYFEKRGRKENIFAKFTRSGANITRTLGDIGSLGESDIFNMTTAENAERDLEKIVRILLKAGYVECDAPAPSAYAPETAYLEHATLKLFIEITETNGALKIRRGGIGAPCRVYNASAFPAHNLARMQFERLLNHWGKQGYARTTNCIAIIEGSRAVEIFSDAVERHPTLNVFFDIDSAEGLRGKHNRFVYFPNGLVVDGDFEVEETADTELFSGLIIDGDVRVSGLFSQLTYTYPSTILITGNVAAHSLGHADSFMRIKGNVVVQQTVYGNYNDGSLQIEGTVSGEAWISCDHDMWANGEYKIHRFLDGETKGLSSKVIGLNTYLDSDAVQVRLREGKSMLSNSAKVPEVAPQNFDYGTRVAGAKTGNGAEDVVDEITPLKKTTESRAALELTQKLCDLANSLQAKQPLEAKAHYETAMTASQPFCAAYVDDFQPRYLYARLSALECAYVLEPLAQAAAEAQSLLEYIAQQYTVWTSEAYALAQFAKTTAHTVLADYALQDAQTLNLALRHTNAALAEMDSDSEADDYEPVLKIKVRALQLLQRQDEAYATTEQMLRRFPEATCFAEIAQSDAYKRWDLAS